MFSSVSFRLGTFRTVSLPHKTQSKTGQTGVINAKVRAKMSCKNFFTTNTPDPHHWTLNSCFCAFLSVQVHLGTFRYCTKLGAKCAKLVQLMQKFGKRCLVRIFGTNARDPHHWILNSCFGAFLFVWVHLELFCYCTKHAAKRAKLVQLMQKFRP